LALSLHVNSQPAAGDGLEDASAGCGKDLEDASAADLGVQMENSVPDVPAPPAMEPEAPAAMEPEAPAAMEPEGSGGAE